MYHNSSRYAPAGIDVEDTNDSRSLTISLAGKNKKVLEVGNSTGYVSKLLRERGNAVTGLEVDPEAAASAREFCDREIVGDAEALDLDAYLEAAGYDVIVLADILEHLKYPGTILKKMKKFLAPEGYLVVSLPNACHGDLLLNLLSGDFRYTDIGLLDRTHLRFFGLKNIVELFNDQGYEVSDIHRVVRPLGTTELWVDMNRVPQELQDFIKALPDTSVYQFVFTARPFKSAIIKQSVEETRLDKIFKAVVEDAIEARMVRVIQALSSKIGEYEKSIADKDARLETLSQSEAMKDRELASIHQSLTWRTVQIYHGLMGWLMPHGTRRRTVYDRIFKGIRILANEGGRSFLAQFRAYLGMRKRSINPKPSDGGKTPRARADGKGAGIKAFIEEQYQRAGAGSPEYVPISDRAIELKEDDVRLIAFYLPQFHPVPENDKNWGKGFTEWTNVSRAVPQFAGHYQPRLPDELGFYDLRLVEVQKRQAELAKQYGVHGFCFHYYWFNGKRLLEKPLDQYLRHPEIDFPFCICWANENWTRRWDGMDTDVIIAQGHDESSDLNFIRDLEPYLRDPRYIRINGRPLIIVYRVNLMHDAKEAAGVWRKYCAEAGMGDPYLVMAQGLGNDDPREYGFDAAVEFPPNSIVCRNITHEFTVYNPEFKGNIFDYRGYVESKEYLKQTPYRQFKNVAPAWDNTPRRPNNGSIYWGASPDTYREWLANCIEYTKRAFAGDERIVFINAWNEWAEGAYLEPDRKYGYGNLQATADALLAGRTPAEARKKIIYVSHDAHYHGAQMLALNTVKTLKERFHYDVHVLLKKGGRLEGEFGKYATVYNLEEKYAGEGAVEKLADRLYSEGASVAICNTVVSGDLLKLLSEKGIRAISLVHEMPELIREYKMEGNAALIARYADRVVFASGLVKEKFQGVSAVPENKCSILPQGLYLKNAYRGRRDEARARLRRELGMPGEAGIVLAVGYADPRKGPDLFAEVAKKVIAAVPDSYFIWVGHHDDRFMKNVLEGVKRAGLADRILFPGIKEDIGLYYAGADLYLMTSREDPFPSTVLEALDAGTPVIGFDEAGGFRDIVTENTGALVPYLDVRAMGEKTIGLLKDNGLRETLGKNASRLIEDDYRFSDYAYALLALLGHEYKKVSAIVPNYNYGRYLKARLRSIASQEYPVYEVIVLDDGSSDDSLEVARRFAGECAIPVGIATNEENSGSVFRQWARGIGMAKGDYVWIAEADDLCEGEFLAEAVRGFADPRVVLSYCQSKQMDGQGRITANDYRYYTDDIDGEKWKGDYVRDGVDEVRDTLAVKNTIPNVSGVVFKKYDVAGILDELMQFRVAGDLFFYVWLLQKGRISYRARPLNVHRRHTGGVTQSGDARRHFDEIVRMQDYIMEHFAVDEATRKKVFDYREKVKAQLMGAR